MSAPRIIIEPQFSLEHRLVRHATELSAQSGYLLIHFLRTSLRDIAAGTLLLNPHQTFQLSGGRSELLLLQFAPQLLIETAARLRLHPAGAHLLFRHPLTPVTRDQKLKATLAALAYEMAETETGWREVIAAQVSQLAVYLLRSHINVQRSDEIELSRVGMVDRRLRRAIEFMHDNCDRELTLAEIATAACLSEFHFARLFKKITGTTPHAHLAVLRIEKARRLLAETDLSISEVGARVGYTSQSHFTRVFRATTSLTPRAFRAATRTT